MIRDIVKLVNNLEIDKLKKMQFELKDVMDLISKFIIKKKLILYGGLVINLILPKKYRFYKDYTINDYDCYSKSPFQDSLELAKMIKKKGYTYIKIRNAKHIGTYKVSVFGKQIFDISMLDIDTYNKYLKFSNMEKKTLKYYNDKYKIIPFDIIKQNLYFELARPEQSGYRWEKIYDRLNILIKVYPTMRSVKNYKCLPIDNEYKKIVTNLLKYIKNNKNPIIDSYPLKLYNKSSNCCFRLNEESTYITIMSENYKVAKKDIIKIIKEELNKDDCEIILQHNMINTNNILPSYNIKIKNNKTNKIFNIIKIILVKNECFSINIIDDYSIGSVDTILYFLYTEYISNRIYNNDNEKSQETLYYINQFEDYINAKLKNNVEKRLNSVCYGKINDESIIREMWKKKMTLKYIS